MDIDFIFQSEDWHSSSMMDYNYLKIPENSGVYILCVPKYINVCIPAHEILYIGSSNNLLNRYNKHEIIRILKKQFGTIFFYFKVSRDYRNIDKELIKKYQPKYNKQWR